MERHVLDPFFRPRTVAVFGASERAGSVGAQVYRNLQEAGFEGTLFAVNPRHASLRGQRCYARITDVPAAVDLAVVATPAVTVPDIIAECGQAGVRAAIVLSAGFSEQGASGAALERRVLETAARHDLRIIGPNCLGVIAPHARLNATFSRNAADAGNLALVSQSGAMCTAILDWALPRQIGFSALVSLGDSADVDFGDVLDYLSLDEKTSSILLYVEGVRHARRFMSGLRAAARVKPVVVLKAGRHEQGARAAASHTGAIVGADDAFDAALERAGAVRVQSVGQLFTAASALASGRRMHGNRLAVISNAGGPAVMATDRAADVGIQMAELSPATIASLDAVLPAHWPRRNPVDVLGDAPPERYRHALTACLGDSAVDAVLVILTPQAITDPEAVARIVIEVANSQSKPVVACWMGEAQVASSWGLFGQHQLPHLRTPEAAVDALYTLTAFRRNQELLLQVPPPRPDRDPPDSEGARLIVEGALAEGREWLDAMEARAVLRAFHIPVVAAMDADSAQGALVAAETLGLPVAMKIRSPDIVHKSDVGGVRLNLASAAQVKGAFADLVEGVARLRPQARIAGVTLERMHDKPHARELLVGILRDPAFGPVIAFGAGGTAAEVLRDRAVALPPLNRLIARNMMSRTRISELLGAYRNLPPADTAAIESVLVRISELACELPAVRELDINPLVADERGVLAVDVRIRIESPSGPLERYGHMAIHPYPAHLVGREILDDGTAVAIRPIRPEDAELEAAFVRNLSDDARYFRFMHAVRELTPSMLVRFTQIDYDREMALIAVGEQDGAEVELAVARYVARGDGESCEFAIVVADAYQRKGLGTRLLTRLMDVARSRGIREMSGTVMTDNFGMLRLMDKLGFTVLRRGTDASTVEVKMRL